MGYGVGDCVQLRPAGNFEKLTARITEQRDAWVHDKAVELMVDALARQGFDVDSIFSLFDVNRDGTLSIVELRYVWFESVCALCVAEVQFILLPTP